MKNNYIIKSRDLIYRKHNRASPFYVYILLLLLNYIPKRFIASFEKLLKLLKLTCKFKILNRELKFYLASNLYDFKYHGGFIHELRISENILRLASYDSIFYDVGSAVGWYSILLSKKCKKIFGFDPEDNASLENVKLNEIKNFQFYPYFLSDSVKSDKRETTVDELVKIGFEKPDIIKIDVEGDELKVLNGSKNLFESDAPKIVLVETHSEKLFYDCLKFLQNFNYNIYNLGCPKINTGGDIYPLVYDLKTDVFKHKSEARIILALKNEKL
jgi:hypothetical protein